MKRSALFLNTLLLIQLILGMFLVPPLVGYAQTSLDWSKPVNISNSGSAYDPLLIVDMDGAFHVIWFDLFDGYKYAESDDGATWTKPKNVAFPFSPTKNSESTFSIEDIVQPRFVVDPNGAIHIFWLDNRNNLNYRKTQSNQLDAPTTWIGSTRLSESVLDFDAKIDADGNVHLAFLKISGTDSDPAGVYYRNLIGANWSGMTRLYTSQYFRSLQPESAHVRVAVSPDGISDSVYMIWEDPSQKRVFMSSSADAGKTWGEAYVVVEPDEKSGYETPHNAEIDIVGDNILLMWQTGKVGLRCVQNSRLSDDGGITWGEVLELFGDLGVCPVRMGFDVLNNEYSVLSFKIEDNLALIAWNGSRWSDVQIQNELSNFQNPLTLDQILLGCQQLLQKNGVFYVVGCDEGSGKDIWFTSREIAPMESWFPPRSAWSKPSVITRVSFKISSISSISDRENNIHAVWTSRSTFEGRDADRTIYHAVWNKIEWSAPIPIITDLSGYPSQLFLTSDNKDRLMLVWVDETNGNLLFSWANSSRANIPLEWSSPKVLPIPGRLVNSPRILTDGAGTIVVVYSEPFNEDRGIYIVRSADLGENWSEPVRIFDAVASAWDSIDQPRLIITEDGSLHSLFIRFSLLGEGQPMGLYYSRSEDGGVTWSDPTGISDGQVSWSNIIADDDQNLHVLWQNNTGVTRTVYDRFSSNNGQTWSNPITVSASDKNLVASTSIKDVGGQPHLLRITFDKTLDVQEWAWDGLAWNTREAHKLSYDLDVVDLQMLHAGSTPDGYLYGLTFIEANDANGDPDNRLVSFSRFVDVTAPEQLTDLAILPTPVPLIISTTDTPGLQSIPADSPLASINDIPSTRSKNIVGIAIIVLVVIVIIFVVRPRR